MLKVDQVYNDILYRLFSNSETENTLHSAILRKNRSLFEARIEASNQSLASVSDCINKVLSKMELTPLHLTAMMGAEDETRRLLQLGANPNCKDTRGWTPLHHSAVRNDQKMLQLFKEYKGNPEIKNLRNGTVISILKMSYERSLPESQVCYYQTSSERMIQGDGTTFTSLTSAESFADQQLRVPAELLVKDWAENSLPGDSCLTVVDYELFQNSPPKLFLNAINGAGWAVCAGQFIPKGTIVTEYLGQLVDLKKVQNCSGNYVYEGFIDATNHRCLGSMINDSFPNVRAVKLYNCNGLYQRIVFQALEDIVEGEVLAWDYGKAQLHLKQTTHIEFCADKLEVYFQKVCGQGVSLLQYYEECQRRNGGVFPHQMALEDCQFFDSIAYLLLTPTALCRLICKKIIPFRFIKEFVESKHIQSFNCPMGFIETLGSFAENLDNINERQIKVILDFLEKGSVPYLIKILKQFSKET